MTKGILYLSFCVLFAACKFNKTPATTTDTTKSTAATGKTTVATGIIGIWAKQGHDNPAFEINQDNIYYPDHAASYPYDKYGDSVLIHYKAFTDTFKSEFKGNDTLILSNKSDGRHIYYRYKN
ncbi:MAG: hypothetical protein ACHQHN_08430 [Sphingobacteriales bacterium]